MGRTGLGESTTRGVLALAAAALAALAAIVASQDGDADLVPFFVGLTFLGGVGAWAAHPPFNGWRRWFARGAALLWVTAALWAAVLLLMSVTVLQASSPPPSPEVTYLGLTATVYHVIGLYGGATLMLVGAFAPDRWLRGRPAAGWG